MHWHSAARLVRDRAQRYARRAHRGLVSSVDLLLALSLDSYCQKFFGSQFTQEKVFGFFSSYYQRQGQVITTSLEDLPLTPHADQIIKLAEQKAEEICVNCVLVSHLCLAIVKVDQSCALSFFHSSNVNIAEAMEKIEAHLQVLHAECKGPDQADFQAKPEDDLCPIHWDGGEIPGPDVSVSPPEEDSDFELNPDGARTLRNRSSPLWGNDSDFELNQ